MGRLIDADFLKRQIASLTIKNNYNTRKATALIKCIDLQPTAYDEDKVVERIAKAGRRICEVTMCNQDCVNCDHGCLMNEICIIVKGGGV